MAGRDTGYYLLPYNLENYSSSCKTCNTRYKLDRFPIAGRYSMKGTDPRSLLTESPLLIYPVGNWNIVRSNGSTKPIEPQRWIATERPTPIGRRNRDQAFVVLGRPRSI